MKKLIALGLLVALAGCANTVAPTDAQVQRIKAACAIDAGIRPSVQALEIFATPDQRLGLAAARAVIDPICANPAAPADQQALTAFSAAVGQVVTIKAQLDAAKH